MDLFMLGFTVVFMILTLFGGIYALFKINKTLSSRS